MKQDKWSYKVLNLRQKTFANAEAQSVFIEDQINQLGMKGWELVNVVSIGTSMKAFFKK